jgi:hypothetical protein
MGGQNDQIAQIEDLIRRTDPRYIVEMMRNGPKDEDEAIVLEYLEMCGQGGGRIGGGSGRGGFGGF